jgi:hypothetical protein
MDGMDKPVISWRYLPKTPGGIPLNIGYEDYKIDWTGYVPKTRSLGDIKRRQAEYAKWKKEQEK